jgi:drug/metabolite transporter (DMT)-like permease
LTKSSDLKTATGATGDEKAPQRREHVALGILFMVGATVMFASSSAISKWQLAIYPFGEVLAIRALTSLVVCAIFILPHTGMAVFRTNRLRDHVGRGVSQATSQTFIIIAFSMMPLGDAVAINFSAPLFATLFAALWLKEAVGPSRGTALLAGFAGVLIVTQPGAGSFQLGTAFALANAVLYGTVTVAVRGMTATESALTLTMWQMVVIAVFQACLLVFGTVWPTPLDASLLTASGAFNALGQYWWTRALQLAPAPAVTPFYYLSLVWAMILGFLVWGDVPTAALLTGSAIVVGSGLFLLLRETRRI